jgi:hypothetical protein
MLKKVIKYTDYNDVQREETFNFNLTQAEVAEMELSATGGLVNTIEKVVAEQDGAKIVDIFKSIILKAYGEKSADGKRFVKGPEISKGFSETEAYSILFMELATDAKAAAAFINAIVPQVNTPPAAG